MRECVTYGFSRWIFLLPQEKKRKPDLSFEALPAQTTGRVEIDACLESLETTPRILNMLSFWF